VTERVWTVRDALEWTTGYLAKKRIEQPRLSAEWLLSSATQLSRVQLYALYDRPLSPEELVRLRQAVEVRATGTPLQYVTGEMPFRHIVVKVVPGVFIPRPETEILVDSALGATRGIEEPRIVDLCTGSGCVACSIAEERAQARVWATELDATALGVARDNVERLGLGDRVSVLEGDLFDPLPRDLRGGVDAVVANPPYVSSEDMNDLPEEVFGHEPHLALDGGPDGLDVARRIMRDALEWLAPGRVLLMELDERRVEDAANEMQAWYEGVETVSDLADRPRIVSGRRP